MCIQEFVCKTTVAKTCTWSRFTCNIIKSVSEFSTWCERYLEQNHLHSEPIILLKGVIIRNAIKHICLHNY